MSERDRERLRAQARDLADVERNDELTPDQARRTIDGANADRERAGRPPLDEEPDPPELGFYERARALGLRRVGG